MTNFLSPARLISIALALFGVVLSLGIAEGIFRVAKMLSSVAPQAKPVVPTVWDPKLGFMYVPNSEFKFWISDGPALEVENVQKVNGWGFLDQPVLPADSQVQSILIVGDSFVEGMHVPLEEKFGLRLQSKLGEALRQKFPVFSLGHSGTGQVAQYSYWRQFSPHLNPKFVILSFYNNDIRDNHAGLAAKYYGWDPQHPPRFTSFLDTSRPSGLRDVETDSNWNQFQSNATPCDDSQVPWILRKSALVEALKKTALHTYYPQLSTPDCRLYEGEPVDYAMLDPALQENVTIKEAYQISSLAVRRLVTEIRGRGAEPIFLVADAVPLHFTYGRTGQFKTFYDWVRRESQSHGAQFLALSDEISSRNLDYKTLTVKDGHWNKQGHDLAAEIVGGYILSREGSRG